MNYPILYWQDVEVGQELPALEYDLTHLRLVAFLRATGLYDYVHFDREYAKAAGARDAFISAPHVSGLFSRFITDWTGPAGELRSIRLQLKNQSCIGDTLRFTGRVTGKHVDASGAHLLDLQGLNLGHQHAPTAALLDATVRLPSKGQVPTAVATAPAPDIEATCDPEMPEQIRDLLGREREIKLGQGQPVSAADIHLWCEALEDWNPMYWDAGYATGTATGGIVVPPTGRFFGIGSAANMGVGYMKPGTSIPEAIRQGKRDLELLKELRAEMIRANTPFTLPGYTEVAVVNAEHRYLNRLRPGQATRTFARIVGCSAQKKSRLGEGYFVTWTESVRDLADEVKTLSTLTGFFYR